MWQVQNKIPRFQRFLFFFFFKVPPFFKKKKKEKKKKQDLWALQAFMNRSAFLLNKRIETTKQKSHPFLLVSLAEAMAALWILM